MPLCLQFLCAINLLHSRCNGNGPCLEQCGEGGAVGCGATQLGLGPAWLRDGVPEVPGHWNELPGPLWFPRGHFAVANRITDGLRICFPIIWHHVCGPRSEAVCAKVKVMKQLLMSWCLQMIMLFWLVVMKTSGYLVIVLYVQQSTSALQPLWKRQIFCFNQDLVVQKPSLHYPLIRGLSGLPVK